MTLCYGRLFASMLLLVVSHSLLAQSLPYSTQQRARLSALGETLSQNRSEAYTRAESLARLRGQPIAVLRADGSRLQLRGLSATGHPLYDQTYSNSRSAATTRTNLLYAGGGLGLSLTGGSAFLQNKLGIWDGGRVRATHRELTGRVTQVDNPSSAVDNHSTHVSGTMIATGRNLTVKGMAFAANLRAWDFSNDNAEMALASAGLLLSNHSYGAVAGWNNNADRAGSVKWEWYGDTTVSVSEDYNFGFYSDDARSFDQIAYNAPYYLIVKSAGNDHGDSGPGPGLPYILVNNSGRTSTQPRNDQTGYDQISTYGTAKNILTVAATTYLSNGYNQPADVGLASFSSWGPSDDGRIKPDIAGVGVNVLSSGSATDSAYVILSGTSMSSPNVTGSLLLLQELYGQRNNGQAMRSSTLKGLVLHTADEAGSAPGPDYRFGWGLLNSAQAARVLLNDANNHRLEERTLETGGTYSLSVVASGRGPLVATICWTDPEATVTGRNALLNNRTPKLINDLDLRISSGGQTVMPWILDVTNPANPARRGDNVLDNVEQVRIDNPVPGQTYTITVSHKNTTLTNSRQDYALIASGVGGMAYCASAATTTTDSKIGRVQFGPLDQRGPDGCTAYTSFLNQTPTDVTAGQTVPLTVTTASCGVSRTSIVKAFADWNLNGSFDDTGELLATSGPLATGATFTANMSAPTSVTNGQFVRLRIVLTETANAGAVAACGPYPAGETQEFLLRVVRPANDIGAVALLSPDTSFCASAGALPVTVRVRNFGSAAQTNVPVTVRILDAANAELGTLTSTLATIPAFADGSVTLRTPANLGLAAGKTYRFVVQTGLPTDLNITNDQLTVTRTVTPQPTGGLFTASTCGTDTVVTLRNSGPGTAYWYDGSGNLLASGNQTIFTGRPAGGQFNAALDDFGGTLGPVAKSAFTGGTYFGNFGPAPLVTTTVPVVLERARLYIASAGRLTFTVRRFDETPISSVTLDVLPTRNASLTATTNSQLVDDPADPGAEYVLNLRIPTPGDYKITIEYENGASLFRSNQGVTGFPYRLTSRSGTPVIVTKGSLSGSDTLKNAWYYLYNLQVRSLGCPSARSVVAVTSGSSVSATISADGGTTLCEGSAVTLRATPTSPATGAGFQWLRNDQPIVGAISATYQANATGRYAVQVVLACAGPASAPLTLSQRQREAPAITQTGLILTSSAAAGNQWFLNGVAIAGATSSTITISKTGRYSVRANPSGCGETLSDELYVAILAVEEETPGLLRMYPNPAQQTVTVEWTPPTPATLAPVVQIRDNQGRLVLTGGMQREGKLYKASLSLGPLAAGLFFVVIESSQGTTTPQKLVKW